MYKTLDSKELMDKLRSLGEEVSNLRLNSIEVEKKTREITYLFICDKTVGDKIKQDIYSMVEEITPPVFTHVNVLVKKIVSNNQLINTEIYRFINENYTSLSIFLKPTDVNVTIVGEIAKYTLRLTEDGVEYVNRNGILKKINEHLSKKFCSDFAGSTVIKEAEEQIDLLSEEVYVSEVNKIEHRTIKVKDVVTIDDMFMGDTALYIEDAGSTGHVTVCGNVVSITEKVAKNDKPFFIIQIDDTTGTLGGIYFSKKSTLAQIRELTSNDCIIATGRMGEWKGEKRITFEKINKCKFPDDFVKKDRYKKKAPQEYKNVFPSPAKVVNAKNFLTDTDFIPQSLTEKTYVVFDVETTGKDAINNGITEIGAVKIVGGKITEQFTTLVKPDYHIPDEIVGITGISDEMVKDCLKIQAVLPDFMKFIEGATLVAHNADFDMKFIKRFANAEDYEVKNEVLDTLALSRKLFPSQKHHDLKTMATNFNIVFHHHRALADAYATAELLIELLKLSSK